MILPHLLGILIVFAIIAPLFLIDVTLKVWSQTFECDLKAERDDAGESRLPHLGFLRVVRVDQDRRDLGTDLPRRRSSGWLGQRFPTTSDPTPDGWPKRLSSSE